MALSKSAGGARRGELWLFLLRSLLLDVETYCEFEAVGEAGGAERKGDVCGAGLSGWLIMVCGLKVTDR